MSNNNYQFKEKEIELQLNIKVKNISLNVYEKLGNNQLNKAFDDFKSEIKEHIESNIIGEYYNQTVLTDYDYWSYESEKSEKYFIEDFRIYKILDGLRLPVYESIQETLLSDTLIVTNSNKDFYIKTYNDSLVKVKMTKEFFESNMTFFEKIL